MLRRLLICLLFGAGFALCQPGPPQTLVFVFADPIGTCVIGAPTRLNVTPNPPKWWGCNVATLMWVQLNTGASGTGNPGGSTFSTQSSAGGSNFSGTGPGTAGQLYLAQGAGGPALFKTLSQDCTITLTGVITCLKTNNTAFTAAATTAIGTSGAVLGLLNANLTFGGANAYGTPASITLTNATGLPVGGLTGLGTGVATALGTAVSGSGAICLATGSACGGGSSNTFPGIQGGTPNFNSGSTLPLSSSSYPGYLAAYNGQGTGSTYQIGLATSTDGTTFSKYAGNPILSAGTGWEAGLVKDPWLIKVNDTYYLYYDGRDSGTQFQIGLATSTDGITWTKFASNPVVTFSGATNIPHFPHVVYDPSDADATQRWKMWYDDDSFRICYAYSPDGYTWTPYASNPVMTLGAGGAFDDTGQEAGAVIKLGSTWYLFYSGRQAADADHDKVGVASFTNPKSSYTKSTNNPVLSPPTTQSASLTVTTTIGSTTVKVANSALFVNGSYVFLATSTADATPQLTRITAIPDGTTLTIRDASLKNFTTGGGAVARSAYWGSFFPASVVQSNGTYLVYGSCYNVFPGNALRELSCVFDASPSGTAPDTGWTIDYARGVIIALNSSATAWDGGSAENPSISPLAQDTLDNTVFTRLLPGQSKSLSLGGVQTTVSEDLSATAIFTAPVIAAVEYASPAINLSSASPPPGVLIAGPDSGFTMYDRGFVSGSPSAGQKWLTYIDGTSIHWYDGSDRMTLSSAGNWHVTGTGQIDGTTLIVGGAAPATGNVRVTGDVSASDGYYIYDRTQTTHNWTMYSDQSGGHDVLRFYAGADRWTLDGTNGIMTFGNAKLDPTALTTTRNYAMPDIAGTVGIITGTPSDNDCAKIVVTGAVKSITSAGAGCGSGTGAKVQVGGSVINSTARTYTNYISGTGITQGCADDAGNDRVNCTPAIDPTVAATVQAGVQNDFNRVIATGTSTAYVGCPPAGSGGSTPTFGIGSFLQIRAPAANVGGVTLNACGTGAIAIKDSAGADPGANVFLTTNLVPVWFDGTNWRLFPAASGSMVYPGAGVANSTGSAWGTSYTVGTSANNLVQLTAAAKLPAVDGSLLTNLPGGATKISGNASITVGAIGDGECAAQGTTITVTGAIAHEYVSVAPSVDLATGLEAFGKVLSTDTVTVEVCNWSGAPVTPGTATYTAYVVH